MDSAELAGLAVVSRDEAGAERVLHHSARRVITAADVERAVEGLTAFQPDLVVIEEPFYSPRFPGTGLILSRLLGRWLQSLERGGWATATVPASMWQGAVLAGVNQRSKSADRKAAAQAFVRERFEIDASEDEADAVCLAVFVLRNATRRPAPPARKAVAGAR